MKVTRRQFNNLIRNGVRRNSIKQTAKNRVYLDLRELGFSDEKASQGAIYWLSQSINFHNSLIYRKACVQFIIDNQYDWDLVWATETEKLNAKYRNGISDDDLIEDSDEEYLAARLEPYYQDDTDLDEHAEMFHGELVGGQIETLAAKICPRKTNRLGFLEYLILDNGDRIDFENEQAYAAMDRRRNIWLVGIGAVLSDYEKPPLNELAYIGKVHEISYKTGKAHIGSNRIISFYHNFGEVDNTLPTLLIDDEGFPVLIGGNYTIRKEGIIN